MLKKPRRCGTCTGCCTTHRIPELEKPAGTPCPKLGEKGCSIYGKHPTSCREFKCLWLRGGFEGSQRPDRLGLVCDVAEPKNGVQPMVVRELWEGALESTEAKLFVEYYCSKMILILFNHRVERLGTFGPPEQLARALGER